MNRTDDNYTEMGAYNHPHLSGVSLSSYNAKVRRLHYLKPLLDSALKQQVENNKQTSDREMKFIYVTGPIVFIAIWVLTGNFMSGFWSFIIVPVFLGLFSGLFTKDDTSVKDKAMRLSGEYDKLVKELGVQKRDFERTEYSISQNILKKKQTHWLSMSGWEFEKEIAKLYEHQGYKASITKGSGDGGIDIVLYKDGIKSVVQCKNHHKPIGPASVRDLYGAMAHERVKKGIFISSNGYTRGAKEFSMAKQISLLDINDVIRMHESTLGVR